MKGGLVGVVAVVEESLGTGRSGGNRGPRGQPRCVAGKRTLREEDGWSRRSGLAGREDGQMG